MSMPPSRLQGEFAVCVARLILEIERRGYYCTFGDAYRDPRVTYGHPESTHRKRLAVDLNLFSPEGRYITETEAWLPFGIWWEQQHELARWGGRFDDGNHLSFEWEGVK